jgi:hypothetical protein
MRFCLICLIVFISQYSFSMDVDSIGHKRIKTRKNLIENGLAYFNLFNKDPYHRMLKVSNWAYTRYFRHEFSAKVEYFSYGSSTRHVANIKSSEDLKRGEIIYTDFRCVRFLFGKKLKFKNFVFSPLLSGNFRWDGYEEIFIGINPAAPWDKTQTELNRIKSLGIGIGGGIGYIFKNKISITVEDHLMYNFEKIHYKDFKFVKSSDISYSPQKVWSTLHIRLGFLF